MKPLQEYKKISEVLPSVLKKLGLEEKAANAALGPVWRESVGASVSAHSRPVLLQRGCLVVAVDTPVWKMELDRYYKPAILERLKVRDSRIKSLRFQVGDIS